MVIAKKGYNLSVNVNSIDLSYDDLGEGLIPIVFLHGFPFDKTMWQEQLEFLKSTHRVIACDIRGFGKSIDEESYLSMDLFTNDLILFMDKLGLEKIILCGLSMGGFIALNAMKRFPSRFEALILCDTQCIADSYEVKIKRYKTISDIKEFGVSNFNEGFIKNVFHESSITNKPELVEQLRKVVFSNSQHIITQGLIALAVRAESCSILENITIPTLIICGREDAVTPLDESKFMNKNINSSVLHVISNAGHVSNLEEPIKFNKHLRDFLYDFCDTSRKSKELENSK
ncbi:alpha/beta hydrolase [Flavobacterium franklandianum]|uniref:Alpha/beta hydrolase n=1 Tax=Flavobacterium franklandianum TaxID=2594430 RepID=A0A553CPC1_9FLAO|nr:alpha/beta hydrolase [Flavobacterium franklandianum]TRX22234.1 alpha/beta hydrolase [Flavobacterium franklandianum]TRX28920.1 alpha/beta hydrolase [Flavobacterium franklandianum]